ncbi:MAG: carbohydrate porin [Proteobacteria bacterium]|nr:carbohydrate porin [Pseudomonadota bacterium]
MCKRVPRPQVLLACLLAASHAFAADAPDEEGNAYGQFTHIFHGKRAFPAAYTNANGTPNSLTPERERSYTTTATAYIGWRAWGGAEVYFAPEVISLLPLSGLHGLGGSIQNGELEKNGTRHPTVYRSRLFLRKTWNQGGESNAVESGPMQLSGSQDSRRFVLTAGNLAIIDIFDKNLYVGDVRQQFLSMNFLTHASYDFAADARGYTWGIAGEMYRDDWVLRAGRFVGPLHPNQLSLDFSIMRHYGDQVEAERRHEFLGRPGKVRVLAYRNVENMGRWDDAVAALAANPANNAAACTDFNYNSANTGAPDLCYVRKRNVKVGLGVSLEQQLSANAGMFFRAMKSDGKTEVYSYTSADSSASAGVLVKGAGWGRERDSIGIAYAQNWLSPQHVAYLGMGGIDGFIGDGRITYRPEKTFETYYSLNVSRAAWVTLDYQRIANPAYNADRGPVSLYGLRFHAEF